jgi:hypothetical protein
MRQHLNGDALNAEQQEEHERRSQKHYQPPGGKPSRQGEKAGAFGCDREREHHACE